MTKNIDVNDAMARATALKSAVDVRHMIRRNEFNDTTAALAPGYVQANLVSLPREAAGEFLQFCQRNPKACPVLAFSDPGSPHIPQIGEDLDLRTDLPRYRVWKDGVIAKEVQDVRNDWRDDLVSFAIGCSFSFDHILMADGISIRCIEEGISAPAFQTAIPTKAAGRFQGPLVVSMRPFRAEQAIRAIQISSRFPAVHGAPIHIGDPSLIGIKSLDKPEFGSPVEVRADELPVFWACGATPQAVIAASRIPFCITHGAGTMLVTDLRLSDLALL